MTLICAEGILGTGKTMFTTWSALLYYLAGYNLYSNYWLALPHEKIMKASKFVEVFTRKRINRQKSLFCADELWSMVDSRESMSVQNRFVNRILLASRKQGFSIDYNQQLNSLGDKRIKGVTNYFAYPTINEETKICSVDIYSRQGYINTIHFNYLPIANLYDTYEIIDNDDFAEEFKSLDREEYVRKATAVLDSEKNLLKSMKLTKSNVHSILYEKGYDNLILNNLIASKLMATMKPKKA